jgi:hypothetical protein
MEVIVMAAKLKPIARTFVQVKNETWHCYLWKTKQYDKKWGKDSAAITLINDKEIHFRDDYEFNPETIAHELVHAYWTTLHLDSTKEMNIDKIEEIVASFIGKNFIDFYSDTLHVYNELKKDVGER